MTSGYQENPEVSKERIFSHVRELYPGAEDRYLRKIVGIRKTGAQDEKKVLPYPDNLIKGLRIENLSADDMTDDQKTGLEVAVGQLRDRHQRVLEMKYREHKKNDEIGAAMNRAAGTISTYHAKAMQKLKWPEVAIWYRDGYERTLRSYTERRGMEYREDYVLRIGLSIKQFEAMMTAGIRTVDDLRQAVKKTRWYVPVKGIGAKTAVEIEKKLRRYEE